MRVLVHLGYPKCFSTTLQRGVFEPTPELYHLGCGLRDNISYLDSDVERVVESLIKFAPRAVWSKERHWARQVIDDALSGADGRVITLSSEMFGFSFTQQEADVDDKLDRIAELFAGAELQALVVLREPEALVRSIYREFVRMGLPMDWESFVRWGWSWRDRNFTAQLDYLDALQRMSERFETVHVGLFEDLVGPGLSTSVFDWLEQVVGGPLTRRTIAHHNTSLTDAHTAALVLHNQAHRRGMGRSLLHAMEDHRNRSNLFADGMSEAEIFADVVAKRAAIDATEGGDGDLWALSDEGTALLDRWMAKPCDGYLALRGGKIPGPDVVAWTRGEAPA